MWIFLTHRLTRYSREQKDLLLKRLNDHAVSSRSLNYLTATVQDYGITVRPKQQGRIVVKEKFGKGTFMLLLSVTNSGDGSIVDVTIKPTRSSFVVRSLLAFFVIVCPVPLALKSAFVGILFISGLIGLAIKVWWTNDFLEKKLLTSADSFKDRNL
jgi:hypothetical protein